MWNSVKVIGRGNEGQESRVEFEYDDGAVNINVNGRFIVCVEFVDMFEDALFEMIRVFQGKQNDKEVKK